MDFLALPRRDLQALCKRNGVRANMTNAAMADALRALPKVDGIEEYVKEPVRAPEPEIQAVVEGENVGKQGNPLPRGRRAVAKSSEPIETKEDKEEEKGNAKRESSKEDAPALGVGRRGASRRARLVPVVPQLAAMAEEELKRDAKKDNAPAPVVGRRGASRRARPSPAMAALEAESEVAGVEEKQEATMDDVPALGVGRRGANRRARAASSVSGMAGKEVAEEEQMAQIPRSRRVSAKGSSSEPIRLDDSDDEEIEDAKPVEQQEDAQILGVGRRGGASRRTQAAPAVAAPEAKAQEEKRGPVPRGRRVKANSAELIRMDDSKEHTKPEEERGNVPTIAVGRHGASRRDPAPSEAPATRRSSPTSKADEGDVAVEAVPVRATRQRKPTMKAAAAAAAEEKAPRRATRRGEVMCTLLQQEVHEEPHGEKPHEAVGAPNMAVEAVPIRATRQRKPTMKAAATVAIAEEKAPPRAMRRGTVMTTVLQPEAHEEPHGENREAVGALVSYQRCDALKEASDIQKEELNEVDTQKHDEDQDMVTIENEKLMEEIPAEEPSVTVQAQEEPQGVSSDAEPVGAAVSYQCCDALEELEEASYPQKEELNEVDTSKQEEDQDLVTIEDEKLMEETPAEEPSVTDQECTDISEMQEQLMDNEKCHAPLKIHEESPMLGLVSMVTEQASENDKEAVDAPVCHQQCDALEDSAEASDPQKEELNEVDAPKQDDDQDVVISDDKMLMEEIPAEESSVTDDAQEEPEEAVGALVSYQRCDALEELEEASDPQKEELNEVDTPKQDEDQDVVIIEYEKLMEETPAEESSVTDDAQEEPEGVFSDAEAVGALVSYQRCDALEELEEASDPQKEELNDVDTPKQDEDQDVVIIEDEKLMEETPAEETSVTDLECMDNSEMQEQKVDGEKCHAPLATQEEPPILGLVSTVIEQASEDDEGASFQDDESSSLGMLDKCLCEQACDGVEEMELVLGVQTLQAPLTGNESDANHESEIGNFNEVTTVSEEVCKEKEPTDIAELHAYIMDEAAFLDCSSNISLVAEEAINEKVNTDGEETNLEVNAEDGLGCQEEDEQEEVSGTDGEIEKTSLTVDEIKQSTVRVNEDVFFDHLKTDSAHADEQKEVSGIVTEVPDKVWRAQEGCARKEIALLDDVTESVSKSIITMEPSVCKNKNSSEKKSAEPMAVLEEKGVKIASECKDLNELSLGQLKAMLKEKLNDKKNKKEKKRVALARVDENVCRSRAKRQQQDLNLQQH